MGTWRKEIKRETIVYSSCWGIKHKYVKLRSKVENEQTLQLSSLEKGTIHNEVRIQLEGHHERVQMAFQVSSMLERFDWSRLPINMEEKQGIKNKPSNQSKPWGIQVDLRDFQVRNRSTIGRGRFYNKWGGFWC